MAEKDFRVKNGLITGSNTVTVGNSVYITTNGDVGIGISNPSSAQGSKNLVVSAEGNVVTKVISTTLNTGWARYELTTPKVNSYVLSGLYENNGTPYYWLNSGAGVTGGALYDMRYHIFRSATGSEYMRITDSGNVGIGTNSPTQKLEVSGTGLATSDFRAPIFYNSVDTNSYWNGSSLVLRGISATISFRDTNANSAMIHVNDNMFYILRGGTDTTSWTPIDNQWPLVINLNNNDAVFGNTVTAVGGIYSASLTTTQINVSNIQISANLVTGSSSRVSGGFGITSYNIGTLSSGTTTLNPFLGNYQYYTNNGAHTISAPTSDCAIDILVTNGSSAGSVTLSGFTAPTGGGGDTYATTNGNRYLLMIRRINAISTYVWKALQ